MRENVAIYFVRPLLEQAIIDEIRRRVEGDETLTRD